MDLEQATRLVESLVEYDDTSGPPTNEHFAAIGFLLLDIDKRLRELKERIDSHAKGVPWA